MNCWHVSDEGNKSSECIHWIAWILLGVLALSITLFLFSPEEIGMTTYQEITFPKNYLILEKDSYIFGIPQAEVSFNSGIFGPEALYHLTTNYDGIRAYVVVDGVTYTTTIVRLIRPKQESPRMLSESGFYYADSDTVYIQNGMLVAIWTYVNLLGLLELFLSYVIFFVIYDVFLLKKIHKWITKEEFYNPK